MRTKNPRFLEMYSRRFCWTTVDKQFGPRWWGNYLWRQAFASQNRGIHTKLPNNFETLYAKISCDDWKTSVELILVPVGPKPERPRRGSIKHRVFVMCDRCNRLIPAGRIHQHTC